MSPQACANNTADLIRALNEFYKETNHPVVDNPEKFWSSISSGTSIVNRYKNLGDYIGHEDGANLLEPVMRKNFLTI